MGIVSGPVLTGSLLGSGWAGPSRGAKWSDRPGNTSPWEAASPGTGLRGGFLEEAILQLSLS